MSSILIVWELGRDLGQLGASIAQRCGGGKRLGLFRGICAACGGMSVVRQEKKTNKAYSKVMKNVKQNTATETRQKNRGRKQW